MLVRAQMDYCGNIVVEPVSAKWQAKFAAYLQKVYTPIATGEAFFQEGGEVADYLENLTSSQRKDLQAGWPIRYRLDPWIFGHYLGYDAHTVAE